VTRMAENALQAVAVEAAEEVRRCYAALATAQAALLRALVDLQGGDKFGAQVIADGLRGDGDPLRRLLEQGWEVARNGFGLGCMTCPALERPGER
jgi:hypothetical protein